MPQARNYQVEAIVIRKIKLGEADRILHLYTPDKGQIAAVAKGVRRPRSRMSGHLELLTHSRIALVRGRNLDTIVGCQTIDGFLSLKSHLYRGSYGLYAAEMVGQFTPQGVGDPALFSLFHDTLHHFCEDENLAKVNQFFELQLLSLEGYRPQLRTCLHCGRQVEGSPGVFMLDAGSIVCPACYHGEPWGYPLSEASLGVLQFIQEHDLASVVQLDLEDTELHQPERMIRSYMEYILGRKLKAAYWVETVQQAKASSL